MKQRREIIFLSMIVTCLFSLTLRTFDIEAKEKPRLVILDTDIGNDVDDVLAMDMLYKYMDVGKIKLLAVMGDKDSPYTSECIDIMNTWYGYPRIPIGTVSAGVKLPEYKNYAKYLCELESVSGRPLFRRSISDYTDLQPAHILYRKILAEQPDSSVNVISIGFFTNLSRLLETEADEYSPLSGRELVARKVHLLSVMGGDFVDNPIKEYNVVKDISSAQYVFDNWPGTVIVSPFRLGQQIRFPGEVMAKKTRWGVPSPVIEAYCHYRPMPYNRQTWDLTSALFILEPDGGFFNISHAGKVNVDDSGVTTFSKNSSGKHYLLSVDETQVEMVKARFVRIFESKPKHICF